MSKRVTAFAVFAIWLVMLCPAAGRAVGYDGGPLDESEIRGLVGRAPDETDLPDEDALVVFDGVYVTYEDGMASVRRQRLIKLYTEYAIDELGDPRLPYDRSYQDLEIHASRTYLLDGSTMDTPENGYNEVTPFGLDLSKEHLDIREMVVSHVGIERGVSIFLDWTVTDTAPGRIPFSRVYFLHDEFPALEKVIVAKGDLWGETVNPSEGMHMLPEPDRADGKLSWYAKGLAARPRHADYRLGDQIPWVALAGAPTWEDLLGEIGHTVSLAAAARTKMETILDEMEEDEPFISEREALERIAETIKDRTELIRYHPWIFSPLPVAADASLWRSGATPIERCTLIFAVCQERGLEAEVVFPAKWSGLTKDVPALDALGDPLVRVGGPGETWFVDPVGCSVTVKVPVEGGMPYFVAGSDGVERRINPVLPNQVLLSVFWDLDAGEAKADGSVSGPVTETLSWEEPEDLLEGWVGGWADSAEAGDIRVLASGPEGISYAVSLEAPLPDPDDRGRILLETPMPPGDLHDLLPPALDLAHSRTDGLLFPPAPALVHLSWKLRLPEGFLLLPEKNRVVEAEGGSLSVRRTEDERLVEIEYRFEWDGRAVRPEDYPVYREMLLDAIDSRLTRLVLAEEAGGED